MTRRATGWNSQSYQDPVTSIVQGKVEGPQTLEIRIFIDSPSERPTIVHPVLWVYAWTHVTIPHTLLVLATAWNGLSKILMVAQPWSYVHLATTTCCCTTLSMLAFWVSIFLSTTLSALAMLWNAVDIRWHSPPFFPTLVYYSPVSLTKPPFVPSCNISKYVDIACVEIIMPVWTPNSKFDFNEHLQHTKTATSFLRSLSMPFVPKHLPPLRMFVSMVPGCNRNNLKSKKGSSFQHTPQQWETGA